MYFEFYQGRDPIMYGDEWQEPDLTVDFDFINLGESTDWTFTVDGIDMEVSFDTAAMTITAYGSIGTLSAEQINGTYYCKGYAAGW